MYYLKIRDGDGENSLIYYCRNCGHEDMTLNSENVCVSDMQLRRSEQKYTYMVNEYTKYDPTLPRINTIKCPNQECLSNTATGGAGSSKKPVEEGTGTGTGTSKGTIKISKKKLQAAVEKKASAEAIEEGAATEVEAEAEAEAAKEVLASKPPTENDSMREIIYIRYDDINMKYVYLCVHCDTMWKTDNRI
jgi:DNA-directed RNA polymerase subunit M/transcription elongation factor TFIIS